MDSLQEMQRRDLEFTPWPPSCYTTGGLKEKSWNTGAKERRVFWIICNSQYKGQICLPPTPPRLQITTLLSFCLKVEPPELLRVLQVRFWFLTPSPGPPRLLCARVARQVRSFGELLDGTTYPFILVFDSRTTTLCWFSEELCVVRCPLFQILGKLKMYFQSCLSVSWIVWPKPL